MGCSSSKNVEVYSTKAARPEQQNSLENGHLVALTSSSFGLLRLDSQKKSEDPKKEVDDPVNQMYMRMMNLDAPGSQLPQSWSEVSNVLSKLKSEAQSKASSARPGVRGEPETVDVSELLDEDAISKAPPPPEVVEKPKLEKEGSKKKRDSSVIHTLEEVDKLAIVPVESPDESESDDDFQPPFYSSNSNRSRNQRFSLSVRSRAPSNVKDSQKSSKSLSSQSSTLFDEEFLESFKEAFEQLSNGVPSTTSAPAAAAPAQTKSAGKGNKISSSQLGPNKITPFKTSSGVNVNEDKPSPTKPVGQRKSKGPDQKPVNSSQSPNTRNNKLKQSNSVGQEECRETSTTNRPKRSILKHKEAPEINKLTGTNKVKLPQQEEKQPETTKPANRFKNQEVFELNKSSRQKEIPVFSNKKTAPAPAPVKPPSEPSLLLQLPRKCPPEGENKVVLYSTSLRGIRKTFEDCNSVRSLLQSFNVEIDERDVSMDSNYRQELRDLMDKPVAVPRLFIKGRYVGGAEEVVGIHEAGGLEKMLQGIPRGNLSKDCDGCGGMRFIPCTDCSGSCKAVAEDGRVIKCPDCNENGLVRCPICS